MKRIFVLIIIFVFCADAIYAQSFNFEALRTELSMPFRKENNIKGVTLTEYQYEYGVPYRTGNKISAIKYDDHYRIIESKIFDDGEYKGKWTYKFNDKGDTSNISKYDDEGKVVYEVKFQFDEKGNLVEKSYYYDGEFDNKDVMKYDEKNNRITFTHLVDDDLSLDYLKKYTYNDNGFETSWEYFDEDTLLQMKGQSVYDEYNRKIDSIYYVEGSPDFKAKWVYDDSGNLLKQTFFDSEGELISREVYKYNENNQLIKDSRYDDDNVMIEMFDLEYRDDGQIKKITRYGEDEFLQDIWHFKYYDSYGLQRHDQYLNNIEIPKLIRKYTYDPPLQK